MARTPNKLFKRVENALSEFATATGSPAPEAITNLVMAASKGEAVTEKMLSSYEDWRETREAQVAEAAKIAEAKKKEAQQAKRAAKSYI